MLHVTPSPSQQQQRFEERTTVPDIALTPIFQRILVPVDFSPCCRRAVVTAFDLQRRYGSELYLFNLAGFGQNSEFLAGLGAAQSRDEVLAHAERHMVDYVDSLLPKEAARDFRSIATMGDDVVDGVRRAADRCAATCVVLGVQQKSHGKLLRTRVERITRRLTCPVLVVKAPEEPRVHFD